MPEKRVQTSYPVDSIVYDHNESTGKPSGLTAGKPLRIWLPGNICLAVHLNYEVRVSMIRRTLISTAKTI